MTLPESVRSIVLLHRGKVEDMVHSEFNQIFKTPYRLGDDDEVADRIVKVLRPFAAGIVTDQLKAARREPTKFKETWTCPLKVAMLLPCRHTFASRILHEEEVSIQMMLLYVGTCRSSKESGMTERRGKRQVHKTSAWVSYFIPPKDRRNLLPPKIRNTEK